MVIVELGKAAAHFAAPGYAAEIVAGDAVFSFHPGEGGGCGVVFERAVRIGEFCGEVVVARGYVRADCAAAVSAPAERRVMVILRSFIIAEDLS